MPHDDGTHEDACATCAAADAPYACAGCGARYCDAVCRGEGWGADACAVGARTKRVAPSKGPPYKTPQRTPKPGRYDPYPSKTAAGRFANFIYNEMLELPGLVPRPFSVPLLAELYGLLPSGRKPTAATQKAAVTILVKRKDAVANLEKRPWTVTPSARLLDFKTYDRRYAPAPATVESLPPDDLLRQRIRALQAAAAENRARAARDKAEAARARPADRGSRPAYYREPSSTESYGSSSDGGGALDAVPAEYEEAYEADVVARTPTYYRRPGDYDGAWGASQSYVYEDSDDDYVPQ